MEVIVHAGMNKAGSSAVQAYLHAHRDDLARRGVVYPDVGQVNHQMLAAELTPDENLPKRVRRTVRKDRIDLRQRAGLTHLADLIRRGGPDSLLILSGEIFSAADRGRPLHDFLLRSGVRPDRLHFIAYLRHPFEFFASQLAQHVKGSALHDATPSNWVSQHPARARNLLALLEDRAILRPHARGALTGDDVVEDFRTLVLARTGRDLPAPEGRLEVNAGASANGCAMLQAVKEVTDHRPERGAYRAIRRAVAAVDADWPVAGKIRTPAEWRGMIAARNADDWNTMLQLMDCSEEIRAKLRITDAPSAHEMSRVDLAAWVVRHLEPAYADAVEARVAADPALVGLVRQARRWQAPGRA